MTGKIHLSEKEDREAGIGSRPRKSSRARYYLVFVAILALQLYWGYGCSQHFVDQKYALETQVSKPQLFAQYLGALEENYAGKWLKKYAERTQLPGTIDNIEMVNWTKAKFEEYGLEAEIDAYTSYMSYPIYQSLKLLQGKNESVVYDAKLIEDEVEDDPNSFKSVPAFLGYAASGDFTGSYVYCNYGTKEDFETLDKLGVETKDKIAVIRYGAIFRGLKIKFAQEHGFKAALLFTDPADDGEVTEENGYKAYPEGIARNPSAIQRGSAQFLSVFPGDPTTPGYAIKPGEDKSRSDPKITTPKIPALPISFREVTPILEKLSGHGPQVATWPKGLIKGFDYTSVGPNPEYKLNLVNEQDFNVTDVYNVYGKIEGVNKDEVIIIGNHHDSWTPAAGDPHSGSAVMLELARALGGLVQSGWKPQRTILLASWDGEEYGLIGSTEFGEYYAKQLSKKAVAYFNMDVASIGNILHLGSSPLLYSLLRETASLLPYPDSNITLYDHLKEISKDHISALGSGSDYTVFLDHLGIPSVDLGFTSNKTAPVYQYHTVYDSYHWMKTLGDPGFVYHNLMAKYAGLLVLNLSESKLYKFKTTDYAEQISNLFSKIEIPKDWLQKKLDEDPEVSSLEELVAQVYENIASLLKSAATFDEDTVVLQEKYDNWDDLSFVEKIKLKWAIFKANTKLKYFERALLNHDGLKKRPWFKHIIYVSGRYTGYAGQQLPGLVEPIEDDDFAGFVNGLTFFNNVLKKLATSI